MLLEVVQTDTKLFKKGISPLKEDTRTLINWTQSIEIFLEKVQSDSNLFKDRLSTLEKETADLAHNSNSFKERFITLENKTADLTQKTQSMTMGAETLFESVLTVKCINQTLSKGYHGLTDRMSLQEGNNML